MAKTYDDLLALLDGTQKPAQVAPVRAPAAVESDEADDGSSDRWATAIMALGPAVLGALSGSAGAKAAKDTTDATIPLWLKQRQSRDEAKKEAAKLAREELKETRKETIRKKEREEDKAFREQQSERDRDLRRQQLDLSRALQESNAADRIRKQEELNVTQSKQLGLYDLGMLAEKQYQEATSNSKEYDPTKVGQVIDNSDWAPNWMRDDRAVAARAAMSNWVEAFLRDASGAAIPPQERLAYAKDFFPQPGDTAEVVRNKAEMRRQKMENALRAAGGAGKASASTPKTVPGPAEVERKTKDGKIAIFDANTKQFLRYKQ